MTLNDYQKAAERTSGDLTSWDKVRNGCYGLNGEAGECIKKAGGKVFGAVLTAAEKKAMDMEINRQIVEADRRYADDIDAMVLYTLHVHLGFGKKRLRKFYDAFSAEHDRLIQYYQMPDDYTWLCKEMLKRIGVDVEAWNKERKEPDETEKH